MYNELMVTNNLSQYMASLGKIPMTTPEEEKELGYRILHHNDLEAAQRMILAHLRFVVYFAKKYVNYGIPLEDLIQEGNIGLMKAVYKFDPEKGVKLASFASYYIKAGMYEYVVRNWRSLKIATTKNQRKLFFNLRRMKKQVGYLTEAERMSMAETLGVNIDDVRTMEERMYSNYYSFDSTNNDDDDDSDMALPKRSPNEYLYNDEEDPATLVEEEDYQVFVKTKIMEFIDSLVDRDRDIILSRKFTEPAATLATLAEKYDISAARIAQLEEKIVNKLRKLVKDL